MVLTLRGNVSLAETEDGIALLDEDAGQYWMLNPTGAMVLRTLLSGGSPDDAVHRITQEYQVDADTAGRDVTQLVAELCSVGLVEQ
ncbi:lasso peptide biosynthesis PqqD family chaperone [Streptomyces cupreus]|uniref:Lasso peptide biosynthesis PqqD family chaperone n=1 Tax=Streptomyces cupreus TaxID=2759956 RepID=A0A7X1JBD6_9ACTN|nr:lasso peptide biosynthesis PqqD family chaperone [Streptomyces cupreus]MBC2907663.1 lasso peptide biosynthesis PqqD family chaperone [Streptomyces cupreus]